MLKECTHNRQFLEENDQVFKKFHGKRICFFSLSGKTLFFISPSLTGKGNQSLIPSCIWLLYFVCLLCKALRYCCPLSAFSFPKPPLLFPINSSCFCTIAAQRPALLSSTTVVPNRQDTDLLLLRFRQSPNQQAVFGLGCIHPGRTRLHLCESENRTSRENRAETPKLQPKELA